MHSDIDAENLKSSSLSASTSPPYSSRSSCASPPPSPLSFFSSSSSPPPPPPPLPPSAFYSSNISPSCSLSSLSEKLSSCFSDETSSSCRLPPPSLGSSSTYVPLIDFNKLCKAVFKGEKKEEKISRKEEEENKAVLRLFERACRKVGFFQIINHDIELNKLEEMMRITKCFFTNASREEKAKIKMKGGGIRGLFEVLSEDLDQFHLIKKYSGDFKEGLDFGLENPSETFDGTKWSEFWHQKNIWPDESIFVKNGEKREEEGGEYSTLTFQEKITMYIKEMTDMSLKLSQCIAHVLDVDKDYFSSLFDAPCVSLRLLHYPPAYHLHTQEKEKEEEKEEKEKTKDEKEYIEEEEDDDDDEEDEEEEEEEKKTDEKNKYNIKEGTEQEKKKKKKKSEIVCAAHTDYGCFTLLLQDEVGGLQILDDRENIFVNCKPVKGAFVVNIGDMLSYWSGGSMKSTIHRVVKKCKKIKNEENIKNVFLNNKNTIEGEDMNCTCCLDRYSIPFFWGPSYQTKIIPLVFTEQVEEYYNNQISNNHKYKEINDVAVQEEEERKEEKKGEEEEKVEEFNKHSQYSNNNDNDTHENVMLLCHKSGIFYTRFLALIKMNIFKDLNANYFLLKYFSRQEKEEERTQEKEEKKETKEKEEEEDLWRLEEIRERSTKMFVKNKKLEHSFDGYVWTCHEWLLNRYGRAFKGFR